MAVEQKDIEHLREIWADFVYDGKMDPSVPYYIAESWRKCREAGVSIDGGSGSRIDSTVLERVRKANKPLIEAAAPIMKSVFETVERSGYLIVLTDSSGYLLETMGNQSIIRKSGNLRFVPGAIWSNLEVGTNAISLALDYDMPVHTIGPQHYCISHQEWTCSAAPIHGFNNEVIGCINMSGPMETFNEHTLGLIKVAAQSIESRLRIEYNALLMRAALDSSFFGMMFLDAEYRPFWMNSTARSILTPDGEDISGKDFRRHLPGIDWVSHSWDLGDRFSSDNEPILIDGETAYCSLVICPISEYGIKTLCITFRKISRKLQTTAPSDDPLKKLLEECGGDVELAAKKLGISRATLYRRLKAAGISAKGIKNSL